MMAADTYHASSADHADLIDKGWTKASMPKCSSSNGNGAGETYVQFYKNEQDEYAIVYRGSDDANDFFVDVQGALTNFAFSKIFPIGSFVDVVPINGHGGKTEQVHRGIYNLFKSVKRCVNDKKTGKSIKFVAGHSLGGALAEIHAFVHDTEVYTFGALRTMKDNIRKDQCASNTVDGTRYMSYGDPAVGDLQLFGLSNMNDFTHITKSSVKMYADHLGCSRFETVVVNLWRTVKSWVRKVVCKWFNIKLSCGWRGCTISKRKECSDKGHNKAERQQYQEIRQTSQCAAWTPWANHNKKAPSPTTCNFGGHNSNIASNSWSCHSMDHYKDGVCR